jgi:hypothetical protein
MLNLIEVKVKKLDVPDKSGVIYTAESLKSSIENFKSSGKPMLGGCGVNNDQLDLASVTHEVVDLWIEGNYLIANMRILDTPLGEHLQKLVMDDIVIVEDSVAARGLGKVEDGKVVDFELLSIDFINPL